MCAGQALRYFTRYMVRDSGTKMIGVFPAGMDIPPGDLGTEGRNSRVGWGSFRYQRDRFVVTGGGHADYGGNEVYEFELATTKWKRVT